MTESDVFRALVAYYGPSACVLSQVANATGAGHRRAIDAVAIGLWPSRGLYLHAIEIKVSKSDLTRELNDPSKADEIARYCDAFYIAAPFGPPPDVPDSWGWYTISDGKATRTRQAADIEPQPLTRSFVAAIARRLVEQQSPEAVLAEAVARGRREAAEEYREAMARARREADKVLREARQIQSAFYNVDADAIRQVKAIVRNLRGEVGSLNSIRASARDLVRQADAIEELAQRVLVPADDGG